MGRRELEGVVVNVEGTGKVYIGRQGSDEMGALCECGRLSEEKYVYYHRSMLLLHCESFLSSTKGERSRSR